MPSKPTALHALVNKKTLIIEFTGSLALMRTMRTKVPNPKDYMLWTTTEKKVGDSIRTISPETVRKIVKKMRKEVATDPEI
jgi:hypothetical protein